MATPVSALKVPGKIAIGVTDLTIAFPHGGTELGSLVSVVADLGIESIDIPQEESGAPADVIYSEGTLLLSCVFRDWDDDVFEHVFPNTSLGGSSGTRVVTGGGTFADGRLLSSQASNLVFSPCDAATHRGLLLARAVPTVDPANVLDFFGVREFGVSVVFKAMKGANGRTWDLGLLEDLHSLL